MKSWTAEQTFLAVSVPDPMEKIRNERFLPIDRRRNGRPVSKGRTESRREQVFCLQRMWFGSGLPRNTNQFGSAVVAVSAASGPV
jgi:hypothetical protein